MKFVVDNEHFNFYIELSPREHGGRILKSVEDRVLYASECALAWCHDNDVSFPAILLVNAGKRTQYEVNTCPILMDLGLYQTYTMVDKQMMAAIKKPWLINKLKDS